MEGVCPKLGGPRVLAGSAPDVENQQAHHYWGKRKLMIFSAALLATGLVITVVVMLAFFRSSDDDGIEANSVEKATMENSSHVPENLAPTAVELEKEASNETPISRLSRRLGQPGASWTEAEALAVKGKLYRVFNMDIRELDEIEENYPCWKQEVDSNGNPTGKHIGCDEDRRVDSFKINEAKVIRLAFHDCLRYDDGTGGCDGCLNFEGMFERKPPYDVPINTPFKKTTDNNNLAFTADVLEKIYTDPGWPRGAPQLRESLKSSGKSRADLWAFAGLVAVESSFLETNEACRDPGRARNKPLALELGIDCGVGRVKLDFRTGRRDCPTGVQRPYEALKKEIQPNPHGNGEMTTRFMKENFGFNPRESVAIMGAHSVGSFHSDVSQFKYSWTRRQEKYLNNQFYRNLASMPSKIMWTDRKWYGGLGGAPAKTGWLVRPLYKTQERGPFQWFQYHEMCPICYKNSKGDWKNQGKFFQDGSQKFMSDECCNKCFGSLEEDSDCIYGRGVQKKVTKDQTAISADLGLYYKFDVDEDGIRPLGCPGMSEKWATPGGIPKKFGTKDRFFTEPKCARQDLTWEGMTLADIVEQYAQDQPLWVYEFRKAFEKMIRNGYLWEDLEEGPQVVDSERPCSRNRSGREGMWHCE